MHTVLQKVLNQVHYVAWENFVDGRVLLSWASGYLLLALLLWGAWGWGSLAAGSRSWRSASERLFVTIPTGLAILVPLLFVAALVGGYRIGVVALLWLAGVGVPAIRARDASALLEWPAVAWRAIREMPLTWAFLVLFSIGVLLPPTHWDEVMYHLTYPQQWIRAGHLTVDPYAWYPFYTWNWELLQGVALMLRSETLVHLLGWLTGALSTVGVRVFAARLGVRPWLGVIAAAALALTPPIQQYLDSGMIDIPLMLYLLVTTYAFTLIPLPEDSIGAERRWLPAALCAGMFVGMKITGMVYIPLVVAFALYRMRARAIPLLLVFSLTGVTWYAYNLVRSGDPAPPLFSLLLHREPLYWNAEDVAWHEGDHQRGRIRSVSGIVSLPVRLVRQPPPPGLPPAPLYDGPLLGYILLFPFSLFVAREAWRRRLIEPIAAAWYGCAVFVATSTLLVRYATFIPLAVIAAALVTERAAAWVERRRRVPAFVPLLAAVILLVGPLPFGLLAARSNLHFRVPTSEAGREEFQAAIEPTLGALRELKRLDPPPASVYLTQNGHHYNYEKVGYRVVGNATHPGRLPDFRRALLADTGSRFLRGFGVDYLIIDKPFVQFYAGLTPEAAAARIQTDPGFQRLYDDSVSAIYRVAPAASARR